jgi:tetratricopeptide (TPR) repeat protein
MRNNLSLVLLVRGRPEEAEAVLRDVLARRRRVFGDEHPETVNTLNNLSHQLRLQGRAGEAEPLSQEALEIALRRFGEDHRETLRARQGLAFLQAGQGKHREAAEHLGAIVRREREVLSPKDPNLAQDLYNWAATLQNADDQAAAEPILRELLVLVAEHGLEGQDFVPAAQNALAKALEHRGAHAEADELFIAALEERRRRHPSTHPEIAYSLSDYGQALLERGEPAAAEPLLAELVELEVRLERGDGLELATARYLHGTSLLRVGGFAEAEELLVAAGETFAERPDAKPGIARDARAALLELYATWDAAEPNAWHAQRALRWQAKFPAED